MIRNETVLMKFGFVARDYSRFRPSANEARPRALVKHAVDFIKECILSMLTPLRLVPLIDMINRSILFFVHIQH